MILKALKYTRFENEPREWNIVGKRNDRNDSYAYFGNFNLLVGRNASGKSRTLDVIRKIANLFSNRKTIETSTFPSEKFELIFETDTTKYNYLLDYKNRQIINEHLFANDKLIFDRSKGIIKNITGDKDLNFNSIDSTHLLITAEEANEPIYEQFIVWGKLFKDFLFSNQSEKNFLVKSLDHIAEEGQNIEDTSVLVYAFKKGCEAFGPEFVNEIKVGMAELGYFNITDIAITESKGGFGISVEEDSKYRVSQREMSQGMFRILSLLIQLTYVRMCKQSICVLVDDMGEGLDHERAKGIIEILTKKLNKTSIQFFMTSNDRYIMNKIPLYYWTIIDREESDSIFYNYENSKENFDDFKYTGLNNFDFLASDFYSKGFGEIEE